MITSHSSGVKVFDMRAKNLTRAKLSRDLNHCANFIKISYADKSGRRIGHLPRLWKTGITAVSLQYERERAFYVGWLAHGCGHVVKNE